MYCRLLSEYMGTADIVEKLSIERSESVRGEFFARSGLRSFGYLEREPCLRHSYDRRLEFVWRNAAVAFRSQLDWFKSGKRWQAAFACRQGRLHRLKGALCIGAFCTVQLLPADYSVALSLCACLWSVSCHLRI